MSIAKEELGKNLAACLALNPTFELRNDFPNAPGARVAKTACWTHLGLPHALSVTTLDRVPELVAVALERIRIQTATGKVLDGRSRFTKGRG